MTKSEESLETQIHTGKMFKCVRERDYKLYSICSAFHFPEWARIRYYPEEFVYPAKNTKLFVFGSLQNARDFLKDSNFDDNIQIWECDVINPLLPDKFIFSLGCIESILTNLINGVEIGSIHRMLDYPVGTWAVDSVRLTKFIEDNDVQSSKKN